MNAWRIENNRSKLYFEVEDKFNLEGKISSFEAHGNGNVNDTFLLFCQDGERMNRYTLQTHKSHGF